MDRSPKKPGNTFCLGTQIPTSHTYLSSADVCGRAITIEKNEGKRLVRNPLCCHIIPKTLHHYLRCQRIRIKRCREMFLLTYLSHFVLRSNARKWVGRPGPPSSIYLGTERDQMGRGSIDPMQFLIKLRSLRGGAPHNSEVGGRVCREGGRQASLLSPHPES